LTVPVTIAVVTYEGSFVNFADFLVQLRPAIENYAAKCELLIVNNSGTDAVSSTLKLVQDSRIDDVCNTQIIGSPQNNISTARNIALASATNDHLIFLDDDEFPVPNWIDHHVKTLTKHQAHLVSGPTYPLFLFDTPNWIKTVDLHNTRNKKTGQVIDKVGAGNLLIKRSAIIGDHFNEQFGKTGGEDTEFVLRQVQAGLKLVWCNEAAAYEYMPKDKSTSGYYIKRFVLQGQLYRQALTDTDSIGSQTGFTIRSCVMIIASIIIAPVLLLLSHPQAGTWIKRGFANFGHISKIKKPLYKDADV